MNQKEYEDMDKEERCRQITFAIGKFVVACFKVYNNPTIENQLTLDNRENELKNALYMNLKD